MPRHAPLPSTRKLRSGIYVLARRSEDYRGDAHAIHIRSAGPLAFAIRPCALVARVVRAAVNVEKTFRFHGFLPSAPFPLTHIQAISYQNLTVQGAVAPRLPISNSTQFTGAYLQRLLCGFGIRGPATGMVSGASCTSLRFSSYRQAQQLDVVPRQFTLRSGEPLMPLRTRPNAAIWSARESAGWLSWGRHRVRVGKLHLTTRFGAAGIVAPGPTGRTLRFRRQRGRLLAGGRCADGTLPPGLMRSSRSPHSRSTSGTAPRTVRSR